MSFKHLFKAKLNWFSVDKEIEPISKIYSKTHSITIEGKEILTVSAAKAFKGDSSLYNPEDLFLSSIVSCHMMSYLYVCAQNGIDLVSYTDEATATLEILDNGSGRFIEVRLYPKVVLKTADKIEAALLLHKAAHELCFIANSCNFPILHEPVCIAV